MFFYFLSEDGVVEESNTFLLLGETSKRLLSIPMIASSGNGETGVGMSERTFSEFFWIGSASNISVELNEAGKRLLSIPVISSSGNGETGIGMSARTFSEFFWVS